jgi:hypothetical protein
LPSEAFGIGGGAVRLSRKSLRKIRIPQEMHSTEKNPITVNFFVGAKKRLAATREKEVFWRVEKKLRKGAESDKKIRR